LPRTDGAARPYSGWTGGSAAPQPRRVECGDDRGVVAWGVLGEGGCLASDQAIGERTGSKQVVVLVRDVAAAMPVCPCVPALFPEATRAVPASRLRLASPEKRLLEAVLQAVCLDPIEN